jgi:tetratricopeptide (TPR) repeat protein
MRYRSKENVVEELQILSQRYGVNTVIPEDDLFSVKKPRFIELCNAIADEFQDSLHFQFPNGLSVATLDADVIAAMKRMGMTVANIAIESGSHFTQRKIIKKNVDLDRARSVVAECRRQNLTVRTYFILGFPGETREQMQETIDFAGTLECDWATIHPAAPLAGTEMFDQLIARGDIDKSFNWDEAFFQERLYDTPEIGAQELKDLAYRANLQLNFFGNFNLRNGNYGHAIELFEDIVRVYPGHLAANVCLSKALALAGRDEEAAEVWKSAEKLVEENSWMAVHQLERYPDLFPWFNSTAKADVSTHWPRPGLPTAARQHA